MVNTATNQEREIRVAVERVVGFAQEFGEAHLNLACHAAFPLSLPPDLLYQIWANFVPEAPWTAVARVLLSRLCKEVGSEMYEMDNAVRNLLLRSLKEQFGQERFDSLGEFLLEYVSQRLTEDDPDTQDLRQAQQWTALAYIKPEQAARELAQTLSDKVQQEDTGEVLRLSSLVETLSEPLVEAGFEPLLVYGQGMKSYVCGDLENSKIKFLLLLRNKNKIDVRGIILKIPNEVLETNQNNFTKVKKSQNKYNLNVSLIGHAAAGKTSYLAALFKNINSCSSTKIQLLNDDVNLNKYRSLMMNLEQGYFPPPTPVNIDPSSFPKYQLKVKMQEKLTWWDKISSKSRSLELFLSVKDYPGELFTILSESNNYIDMNNYLKEIIVSDGIMIFIDSTSNSEDFIYALSISNLCKELDKSQYASKSLRIALVFTKCEQPEIISFVQQPQALAIQFFPQVHQSLETWEKIGLGNYKYFCTSAVGLTENKQQPNVTTSITQKVRVLRQAQSWKPFGTFAPLEWLCSGFLAS